MINFRYHVVSLSAILLALAAGVVLGAGFLQDRVDADASDASEQTADPAVTSFDSGYVARTSPGLLRGRLDGESVVVLTTPGANAADVKGVRTAIDQAGAEVVGQVELTGKLLDPGGRQFAEGVAQQAGEDVPGIAADGDSYARIGAALARSLVSDRTADVDSAATTLRAAFVEADLVRVSDEPDDRASMAVVVTGPRSSTSASQGGPLAGIAAALDAGSNGVVVTGPVSSSDTGGYLQAVRDDDETGTVSTVDVSDVVAGRAVVALALAEEADGRSGAWGTSRSADGAVPTE